MAATKPPDIVEATETDRSTLARLSPAWFNRHEADLSWCAVEDGQVIAAVMLDFGANGIVHIELNGTDDATVNTVGPDLLNKAAETARRSGAASLDAYTDTVAASRHQDLLESNGFEIHETFDLYSAPREVLQQALDRILERTRGRIKSRFDVEILQIEAQHIDAVAEANSAWIGGSANRGIFEFRRRFHARREDDPERTLQLVAVHEGMVVGFCCTLIVRPGVLKIDGEGIHPRFRLDPLQSRLTATMYERAEAAGIHTITFEAGSRQPNTVSMARRNKVDSVDQRVHLRRTIAPESSGRGD
ncbi:MAG: hypothetical protein CMJ34_04000 [Phycisphaerae bacterium]|nr:hypothetical protein [Phycisphaerae bacterium]